MENSLRFYVIRIPFTEQFLTGRLRLARGGVAWVLAVLDAPAAPFTEGVIAPVPAELLKQFDAVLQIPIRAVVRRPADGTEFAEINLHAVIALPVAHRLQRTTQRGLVPEYAPDHARIGYASCAAVDAFAGVMVPVCRVRSGK